MTRTATITSKGQLTLPVHIRRALNLTAGDQLACEQRGNEIRLVPQRKPGRFAKYRGTVSFAIKGGRKGIVKHIRDLRDGK
jgi:AbrB family looped-hinge helix DNA binding protein